ncbi:YraN family protein [Arcanobacterium phocae]|uniref:YraN family protein n=1 Tax=Arcanobacterium phocae TaxID=131112 RepID=UPI001C0EC917|nr:YraN family protein [Arcanobacterium phocae]
METLNNRQSLGAWGEETASRYVQSRGWAVLDRNWRSPAGELDIVAYDPARDALVAIEVKTRRCVRYGAPEEAVTRQKIERIRRAFGHWQHIQRRRAARIAIDVIAITARTVDDFRLNHIRNVA